MAKLVDKLKYQVAVCLTASVVASATVLAALGNLHEERYIALMVTVLTYWAHPPSNSEKNE